MTNPRGLEASLDRQWREGWDDIQHRAPGLSDGEYVVGLRRLLAWFGQGHTTVLPFEFTGGPPPPLRGGPWGQMFPIRVAPKYDGLWITAADELHKALLGARVVRIGGVPIEKIVKAHLDSWPGENPAWGYGWSQYLFNSAGPLQGLGVLRGSPDAGIALEAVAGDGQALNATLQARAGNPVPAPIAREKSAVERLRLDNGRGNFVTALAGGRVAYASVDSVEDLAGYSFAKLTDEVLRILERPQTERVILDLRRNGGGDNVLAEPLRHELTRSRFNRRGGIFVLIGPATFSAGQNLANRIERETMATFIGEPTGSSPNMIGDPAQFVGKATGIVAIVGTVRWMDSGPQDSRRWIFPDLFLPVRFADWVGGRDAALEAAMTHPGAGADDFASRATYFKRDSQRTAWRPAPLA